jgi:transposase
LGHARGRRIDIQMREQCIELVSKAMKKGARKERACQILGVSVRTLERWECAKVKGDLRQGPNTTPANKISKEEYQKVLEVCTSEAYRDLPPSQIVPLLADKGIYIVSEASFYRILKEEKMLTHRTESKPHKHHKPNEYIATRPNQVWSWDVSVLQLSSMKDEGRSLAIDFQELIANHCKLHKLRAFVVSVTEKVHKMYQVWNKKTNKSEPPFKCRNCTNGIKTKEFMLLWDKFGSNLITVHSVPGIEVA